MVANSQRIQALSPVLLLSCGETKLEVPGEQLRIPGQP